jgi:drug/metabolite transporter (DMT)-like permease
MKAWHLILLLLMNLFWAASFTGYKFIGTESLPSGGIVTLRFGLAGLVLLLAWPWLPGSAPRGRDLTLTCLMGLMLFVLGQRLQVEGNQMGTASNSSVLMAVEPLVTTMAAALFLREYIGPRRVLGFGLAMVGVAVLNGVWRADFHWTGLGASLIFMSSFVCEAGYSVLGKPIVQRAGVMKMLAVSLLAGLGVNLLIDGPETIHIARMLSPQAWSLLAGMALICTVTGYSVWFMIVRECPVNVAALTVFTQSIFGVAIASIWLHEKLLWEQLAGSLVIVAGLVLGLSRQVGRAGK